MYQYIYIINMYKYRRRKKNRIANKIIKILSLVLVSVVEHRVCVFIVRRCVVCECV